VEGKFLVVLESISQGELQIVIVLNLDFGSLVLSLVGDDWLLIIKYVVLLSQSLSLGDKSLVVNLVGDSLALR